MMGQIVPCLGSELRLLFRPHKDDEKRCQSSPGQHSSMQRTWMKYRELGKTGWKVSVLGYGASPLGGAFGGVDEKNGIRTVRAALDLGINFIDVSPDFGAAKAEIVLGKALRGVPRQEFYLATK